jgi:hypothetical protein
MLQETQRSQSTDKKHENNQPGFLHHSPGRRVYVSISPGPYFRAAQKEILGMVANKMGGHFSSRLIKWRDSRMQNS